LPVLLIQDVWRAALFAQAKPRRALVSDLVWLLPFLGGVVLVETDVLDGGRTPMVFWAASGCAAALAGAWQVGVLPSVRDPRRWWRRVAPLAGRLLPEFGTVSLASLLATYVVAAIAGLTAAGALRGAQSLLGVMNVLFAGLLFTLVPHGVGLARSSPGAVLRLSRRVAAACAFAALVAGIGFWILPERVGTALLGAVWPGAREVLVPLAFAYAFAGVIFGATAGLRSFADARRSMRARLVVAPLTVGAAAGGAFFGARGAAVGLALAGLPAAAIWWRSLAGSASTAMTPAHERRRVRPPPVQPPRAERRARVAATD
jgi:O-antigen/teichoic acid export membrane protein